MRYHCEDCSAKAEGKKDPANGKFYCFRCWDKFNAKGKPDPSKGKPAPTPAPTPAAVPDPAPEKKKGHYETRGDRDTGTADAATQRLARFMGNTRVQRRGGLPVLELHRADLGVPSLVAQSLKSTPAVTAASSYSGGLSPRGAGMGAGRYIRPGEDPEGKKLSSVALKLAMTPEDIVAQVYCHFDEDVTKLIINALDSLAVCETKEREARVKTRLAEELTGTLGPDHTFLVAAMLENCKQVLIRLLEEFCADQEPHEVAAAAGTPEYGTSVRFVRVKGEKGDRAAHDAAGAHHKWLQHVTRRYKQLIDESELDAMLKRDFQMGGGNLPSNCTLLQKSDHVRIHVPPPDRTDLPTSKRVRIDTELPPWTHPAFGEVTHLNTIQTKVFDAAFHSNENLLICAPTGAGKTMVALLVMLRLVHEQLVGGKLDRDFKIVYVAPMKALAAEMVTNFKRRLASYMIIVREFTGDMSLTKKEIAETNVIVTTPEKWDVVTRKQADNDLVRQARLLIIDEVHLLNDDRGPVIEAIVARTLRQMEMDESARIRLVGLSATLPNFKDVAQFLHVDLETGLKVFGAEYRPVPLEQTFLGISDKARKDKDGLIDRVAFQELASNLRQGHQVMVFVHARKQTVSLGTFFREEAGRCKLTHLFDTSGVPGDVQRRAGKFQGRELSTLWQAGIGVHHAGLSRFDRTLTEELFRDGHLRVLVCTATLAWGVNLPAHTVIIRGTEIYDAKRGGFVSLSVLDVMQIFGRAGRPQFDTSGHGVIVSTQQDVNMYLRLMAHALPIESKFRSKLVDHLNAEVHAGTVTSIAEAVRWLEYTYLWQRIRANPLAYGLTIADVRRDPELRVARSRIITDAAEALNEACMVRYNPDTGSLDTTDMGRIASHFYIDHQTMTTFNDILRRPDGSFVDTIDFGQALNTIACANEFTQLRVRQDELDDLNKIHSRLPPSLQKIRVSMESTDETSVQWKVTTLLKAYIARQPLDMHSLASDMQYVIQNAARITRALFEIELQRSHPHTTATFLSVGKCLAHRLWETSHPLLQFNYDFTDSVMGHLQQRRPRMEILAEMTEREIGTIVHNQRFGGIIARLVKYFPAVELAAEVQPITRTVLRVKATVTPAFTWSDQYHGGTVLFWLFVEDANNNFIFHHEQVQLKKKDVAKGEPVVVNLTIPIVPEYDMYAIRLVSDHWMHSGDEYVFSIGHLHLPDDAPPTTKLLPLKPLTRDVVPEEFQPVYQHYPQLNPVQTQVFHAMFHTDANVFLGAPTGSGKTVSAEMAMLRVFAKKNGGKVVYIGPLKALVKERMKDWNARFVKQLGLRMVELSGDVTPDIDALCKADILCTTPEKWDGISRNWQVRSYVTSVQLVIFDEVHLLGSDRGPILEVIVSRMRYIGWHRSQPIRLIGLSTAVANPGDLASWLGVDKRWALFNFEPSVRPVPMRCHIAGYPGRHYCPRMATMNKPVYNAIVEKSPTKPVIVFVSSRRQTRLTAMALINFLLMEGNTAKFVRMSVEEVQHTQALIQDPALKHCAQFGVGMHHAGLAEGDRGIMEDLFRSGKIQILVATSTLAWGVNFPAHLVVVKGTEFYDAKTKSYVDFPITDVLQMIGRAGRPQYDTEGVAQVLCHEPKKSFYRKFLYDPFPVESSLHKQLHAHINAEIVSGTIATRQDAVDYLTWTYLFRRLVKNPSYYGVEDPSPKALTLYLSQLVNKVLYDLEMAKCLESPDDDSDDEDHDPNALRFSVLGKICSYYYLSHLTAAFFDRNVDADSTHRDLLWTMCEAEEFAELPVRHNEDRLNVELAGLVPLSVDLRNADSPHVKAFLLFQAHYSRARLPISDYHTDQKSAIDNSIRVLQAMVDVTANNGHLFAALRAMSLMQCQVQARWWFDNTLLQMPHVTEQMLPALAEAAKVTHVADLANATVTVRAQVQRVLRRPEFGLTEEHVEEFMYAMLRLPLVDVHITLQPPGEDDDLYVVNLELTRLSLPAKYVVAPKFAKQKDEQYWLALGHEPSGELVALKRLNRLSKKASARLTFEWDEEWLEAGTVAGGVPLQVYVVCDSFIGLDQQYTVHVPLPEE